LKATVEHDDQLRDYFGVRIQAAGNALGTSGALYRDLLAIIAVELEPRDAIEAMLISQQVAPHVAMMSLSGKVIDAASLQWREGIEQPMTRLSRTFLAQTDALRRYRSKAQPTVPVERVTVNDGGHAIVGPVTQAQRDDAEQCHYPPLSGLNDFMKRKTD